MIESISFAAAQAIPVAGRVDDNVEQHVRLIELAGDAGAHVIVFPELSLTGYELDQARELAFSERDERLGPLRELAASRSMTIVVGAPVRLGSNTHIGAFIARPDGDLDVYTKRHLGTGEEAYVTAGDNDPPVQLPGGFGAVAVCADANHPTHPARAAARGASAYLVSTLVEPLALAAKAERLRSYAVLHGMPVIFANYGGPSGGLESAGRSAIWSESGHQVVRLDEQGIGVALAAREAGLWTGRTLTLDR